MRTATTTLMLLLAAGSIAAQEGPRDGLDARIPRLEHWAFVPPVRQRPPAVEDPDWARNSLDAFVLFELEKRGIEPAPEADRRTLIRRLSFDLSGLPPSPDEVDAFLDDSAPDAYQTVVDRLLASPHHGERMAVWWLDLVRYADTVGYHGDQPMSVWPYRDWVIDAFTENMPFDAFTRAQLAGDLLDGATRNDLVASGYNRLNIKTNEGGAQDAEYLAKYAADRVRTTASVWLGVTLGCAECHDHKFDPFSQRDFYSFAAFFADLEHKGFYPTPDWRPYVAVPTPEQEARAVELGKRELSIVGELNSLSGPERRALAAWELGVRAALRRAQPPRMSAWQVAGPYFAQSLEEAHRTAFPPESDSAGARWEDRPQWTDGAVNRLSGDNAATYLRRRVSSPRAQRILLSLGSDDSVQLWLDGDRVLDKLVRRGVAKDQERVEVDLPAGDSTLVMKVCNGGGGYGFYFDVARSGPPQEIAAIVETDPRARTRDERRQLARHFVETAPRFAKQRERLAGIRAEREELARSIPTSLVSQARAEPRPTRVLARGNWLDRSGEIVEPAIPARFGALDTAGRRRTRRDLADWITAPDNPLTARAFVNRLWKMFFGTGLSRVVDDLGTQGERPTHGALLDWLAVELVESGWDARRIVRLLVTSSTYRQSSVARADLRDVDPRNRLHARQSRWRVEAEFVRDVALAASGLLERDVGGPSVFPYQPAGYWRELNFPKRTYRHSTGADQFRRGLYTHWQRTFVHPSMRAFDAPSREECTAERPASNTPQQALVLLNDPSFVEAARVFAQDVVHNHDGFDARLDAVFRRVLQRPAEPRERGILRSLLRRERERYAADPDAARALCAVGIAPVDESIEPIECAAWTAVTRAVLNLHEVFVRS